jgi:hypothetical protein
MAYYAITTLSTVGLGDFHPQNSFERLFVAFLMLLGVATFSYMQSSLNSVLQEVKDFDKGFEQEDLLDSFFMQLMRFNHRKMLEPKLKD